MADYDLAIIGGGLNGASIARDAAGRGLRVILIEQGDLGGGQAAVMGLIDGGLARLEKGHWGAVRKSLAERDVWLHIAPHVVRPFPVAMPAQIGGRSQWLTRAMLAICDCLSPGSALPGSRTLQVTHHEAGVPLKRPFGVAFSWTECLADIARLPPLLAMDAAERGAVVMTGARCVRADRSGTWQLAVVDRGRRMSLSSRALVNASGAWVASVAETVLRLPPPAIKLTSRSQIVVARRFDHEGIYALESGDGHLVFVAPWHGDFSIVGTVNRPFTGDPAVVSASAADVAHLCQAVNRYFRTGIEAADVVHAHASAHASDARTGRDTTEGTVVFDGKRRLAPLLTVFGGDVTSSRRRAESAVDRLTPFYPMSPRWTAKAPLPGGEFGWRDVAGQAERALDRWPFLQTQQAARLVASYGTRIDSVLGDARRSAELGPRFGSDLTGAEVRYLMQKEWARFPDDVLWRRSRLGLTTSPQNCEELARFIQDRKDAAAGSPLDSVEPEAIRR